MNVFLLSEKLQTNKIKAGNEPQVRQKEFEGGEGHATGDGGKDHPQQVKYNGQTDGVVQRFGIVTGFDEQFEVKQQHHAKKQGFGRQSETDAELLYINQYAQGCDESDEK
jgi:hypothetical protein